MYSHKLYCPGAILWQHTTRSSAFFRGERVCNVSPMPASCPSLDMQAPLHCQPGLLTQQATAPVLQTLASHPIYVRSPALTCTPTRTPARAALQVRGLLQQLRLYPRAHLPGGPPAECGRYGGGRARHRAESAGDDGHRWVWLGAHAWGQVLRQKAWCA